MSMLALCLVFLFSVVLAPHQVLVCMFDETLLLALGGLYPPFKNSPPHEERIRDAHMFMTSSGCSMWRDPSKRGKGTGISLDFQGFQDQERGAIAQEEKTKDMHSAVSLALREAQRRKVQPSAKRMLFRACSGNHTQGTFKCRYSCLYCFFLLQGVSWQSLLDVPELR